MVNIVLAGTLHYLIRYEIQGRKEVTLEFREQVSQLLTP
jgi:hypothetical protein